MKYNPLLKLPEFGQSIWLDYLRRDMLESGELRRLIEEDGLRGMTSNPSIFWKAIDGSDDYTAAIHALADEGKSKEEIYRILTVEDVGQAADIFRPVYDKLDGADGFVSLEVNPHLARDVKGTIKEAHELWEALDRPNVFIKVPATKEGLKAIRQLIADGINVNVTLLFGLERYRQVAEAYIAGLEERLSQGKPIERINSVASFFLSRIDVKVDPQLERLVQLGGDPAETAAHLHGEIAIASAKLAYRIYKEVFGNDRFEKLAKQGARPQRVLWASTSTKDPHYSDIKYVEPLIGPETVNTVPRETLAAYRDHGNPAARIEENTDKAQKVLDRLATLDIDIKQITKELIEEGIVKFNKPYDKTMESLERRMQEAHDAPVDTQVMLLGKHQAEVATRIDKLAKVDFSQRLWAKDATLWSNQEEVQKQIGNSLGWLHVAEKMLPHVPELRRFASEVREAGFQHVVHLGMGGSSLAPLVFEQVFPGDPEGLPLTVLDTTNPHTILKVASQIPLAQTLFIVASKSGTTTETVTFMEYFYERIRQIKGDQAGENFVVITDPGSELVETAQQRSFLRIFLNYADIGGRYSALSFFGILPAVLMGLDIEELLERAVRIAHANQCRRQGAHNPAIELGAAIGELARQGRDKLTFLTSESISSFGLWLEQLVAESTGKESKGILPVAGEDIGKPEVYGDDRVFVYFELQDEKFDQDLQQVRNLADAGHPVVIIRLQDRYDIGQEMMRWEIATATAGAVLEINSFDQPNVQESKDITKRILKSVAEAGGLQLDSDTTDDTTQAESLLEFLSQANEHDYIAIQAYLPQSSELDMLLRKLRLELRERYRTATTVGYGPRYLHSTGQYHKGGPNTGLFVQLVAEASEDAQVPGRDYSFDVLCSAQSRGDLEALQAHGRRTIRINLGSNPAAKLRSLADAMQEAVRLRV